MAGKAGRLNPGAHAPDNEQNHKMGLDYTSPNLATTHFPVIADTVLSISEPKSTSHIIPLRRGYAFVFTQQLVWVRL